MEEKIQENTIYSFKYPNSIPIFAKVVKTDDKLVKFKKFTITANVLRVMCMNILQQLRKLKKYNMLVQDIFIKKEKFNVSV